MHCSLRISRGHVGRKSENMGFQHFYRPSSHGSRRWTARGNIHRDVSPWLVSLPLSQR